MTKIVNIKSGAKYDVYCGRPGKGQNGFFGNSHVIGFCKICNKSHNRDECIDAFKIDFDKRIIEDAEYKNKVLELKDKTLACFCVPNRCHCEVYVNYLDKND